MESSASLSRVGNRDRAALFRVPMVCRTQGKEKRLVAAVSVGVGLGSVHSLVRELWVCGHFFREGAS